jgi:hypothetical protein
VLSEVASKAVLMTVRSMEITGLEIVLAIFRKGFIF